MGWLRRCFVTFGPIVAVCVAVLAVALRPRPSAVCLAAEASCAPAPEDFVYPTSGNLASLFWFQSTAPRLTAEDAASRDATLRRRAAKRAMAGVGGSVVLKVGANIMANVSSRKDRDDAGSFFELVAPLDQDTYRVVLVEPNEALLPTLRERAAAFFATATRTASAASADSSNRVRVVGAAVCPQSSASAQLFRFSSKLVDDYPQLEGNLYRTMNEMASMDKDTILRAVHVLALPLWAPGLPQDLEAWAPYVEAVPVRCLSPSDLLGEADVAPETVDMLLIDTEGYDVELLELFLALGGVSSAFRPAFIEFEWCWHHDNIPEKLEALARVVKTLHSRGYDVRKSFDNMVAILAAD